MKEFLAAAVIFVLAVIGMAVGAILRRRPLRGSCGGLANARDEHGRIVCEACSHPSPECRGTSDATGDRDLSPPHHEPGKPLSEVCRSPNPPDIPAESPSRVNTGENEVAPPASLSASEPRIR